MISISMFIKATVFNGIVILICWLIWRYITFIVNNWSPIWEAI